MPRSHEPSFILKQGRNVEDEVRKDGGEALLRPAGQNGPAEVCHVLHPKEVAHFEETLASSLRSTHGLYVPRGEIAHINKAESRSLEEREHFLSACGRSARPSRKSSRLSEAREPYRAGSLSAPWCRLFARKLPRCTFRECLGTCIGTEPLCFGIGSGALVRCLRSRFTALGRKLCSNRR